MALSSDKATAVGNTCSAFPSTAGGNVPAVLALSPGGPASRPGSDLIPPRCEHQGSAVMGGSFRIMQNKSLKHEFILFL